MINRNLIFDVGLHTGEDTEYYLKKGFNVVAFEANPDLIAHCKTKFKEAISDNRLTIVEGAIIDTTVSQSKSITFYQNEDVSVWGTVSEDWSKRNENYGAPSKKIEVPVVDFKQCLHKYGIPYYLKIDIEGMDLVCLQSLVDFKTKPAYISIESELQSFDKLIKEFDWFEKLGYDKFQVVNQADIAKQKEPINSSEGSYIGHNFTLGCSGLFGTDFSEPWLSRKAAIRLYRLIFIGYKIWGVNSKIKHWWITRAFNRIVVMLTQKKIPGWYDTHAKHKLVS